MDKLPINSNKEFLFPTIATAIYIDEANPMPRNWEKEEKMKKLFSIFLVLVLFFALPVAVSATQKTLIVVSKPDAAMQFQSVYGPLYGYAVLGDLAWSNAKPTVATWTHGSWPEITGATWISTADKVEDGETDTWRWFNIKMILPCTAYNITNGMVTVTSDNAEEFYFNDALIWTDGEVQVDYYDNAEWRTVLTHSVTAQAGVNTLDFVVRNYAPYYPDRYGSYSGGTYDKNPAGLIFKATVDYELPEIVWQPPLTNDSFELKDGTTMPFKFKLYTQAGDLIIDQMNIYMKIFGPSDGGIGSEVAAFWPGEGGDFLRFDLYEFYYIGNFHTKDYGLTEGATYTAVVYDGCTDDVLGTYTFVVSAGKGNRGNKN